MNDASTPITIPALYAVLRRNALIIVFTVSLAVGASIGLSAATDPVYESRSAVAFNDESADLQALGIPASPDFQPDKAAAAQAERITRPDVVSEVRRTLRVDLSVAEIQDAVSTQVEPASNLVSIIVEAPTAELAARLANGLASSVRDDATTRVKARYRAGGLSAQRRASRLRGDRNLARRAVFEDQAARLLALATFATPVDVVRTAEIPESPSSPKPVRNAVLAALLGLILGVGGVFLRQAFDRRLREPDDVRAVLDVPVVGHVATAALGRSPFPAAGGKAAVPEALSEGFRIIRTNAGFLDRDGRSRTIVVTSPLPEEGKSTVATGLAWAEAHASRSTLLVDCDLRRPTVAERLGLTPSPGLAEFLLGQAEPADILRTVDAGDGAQLVVIPAGRVVSNHAELLESPRFAEFLAQVSDVYDRVVIDTAPVLPVSDTLSLLPLVDLALLCVRLGQTTRDDAEAARTVLENAPGATVGVVITAADRAASPYYAGSYAYTGAGSGSR